MTRTAVGKGGGRERPRLLVIAHSAELYGSDRALANELTRLTTDFSVTIAVAHDGPGSAVFRAAGARVVVLPDFALRRRNLSPRGLLPWLWRMASAVATLHRMHRRQAFDVLYSNSLAAPIGPLLKVLWRRPHAIHVRECPDSPTWLPKVLLFLVRWFNDIAICNSNHTRALVVRYQPRLANRALVAHNGIEIPTPPHRVPRGQMFRISCPARIHPKKGQEVLLEAAEVARKEGRHWDIHLYGDTLPEHEELRRSLVAFVQAHELTQSVHWHGFVPDLTRCYGDVDVVVVPSVLPEEFSLVTAEAQGMGLPVVATGPGGPSEILVPGDTGLIVAPKNAFALYTALARLDDEPDLALRMGKLGRQRILEFFSRETYAAKVSTALLTLAADGARHSRPWAVSPSRSVGFVPSGD